MPYTPQTWINGVGGGTPLSAARLNYMETGIEAASNGMVLQSANKIYRYADAVSFPILTMAASNSYVWTTARLDAEVSEGTTTAAWDSANNRFEPTEAGLYQARAYAEVSSNSETTGQVTLRLNVDLDTGFSTGFGDMACVSHSGGNPSLSCNIMFYAEVDWRVWGVIYNASSGATATWDYAELAISRIG